MIGVLDYSIILVWRETLEEQVVDILSFLNRMWRTSIMMVNKKKILADSLCLFFFMVWCIFVPGCIFKALFCFLCVCFRLHTIIYRQNIIFLSPFWR
jgi:hypothetical protein